MSETTTPSFKNCPSCGHCWPTREAFLSDPDLEVIGYQAFIDDGVTGLFLINHRCGTTLALKAELFEDLYTGPIYSAKTYETDNCPRLCFNSSNTEPCPHECECAYVGAILQIIKLWPKMA